MARELSPIEVVGVLEFNPTIESMVQQHDQYVLEHGWNQVTLVQNPGMNATIPIPVWGRTFTDATYGRIIIFPDARGLLHFTVAETPQDIGVANEIDKPVYYSSSPGIIQEFLDQVSKIATGVGTSIVTGVSAGLIIAGIVGIIILTQKAR